MKILTIVPSPSGTVMVYENGQKVPVVCLALVVDDEATGYTKIFPCVLFDGKIVPYTGDEAKVVL